MAKKILLHNSQTLLEVKKSRFLALLTPIEQTKEAKALVQQLRLEHPRARHVCYAYVLHNGQSGSNDDGEPHGTAGRPLLEVLNQSQLVNVCVLVVRYFGGTLLGMGGLCRAYRDVAKAAVDQAQTAILQEENTYNCQINYAQFEKIRPFLEQHGINWTADFADVITLTWKTNPKTQAEIQTLYPYLTEDRMKQI